MNACVQLLVSCIIFFLILCPRGSAAAEKGIGILLSREIAPFADMVKGVESGLPNHQVKRFFLDQSGKPYSLEGAGDTPDPSQYQSLVAVGPSALRYLQKYSSAVPVHFGMVLNPQKIIHAADDSICGVSLNLPIREQFFALKKYFPWMSRLGVLFDPVNNQDWFDTAETMADEIGLELLPIQIESFAGRLTIVGDLALPDVLLFIPDKTIISKAVIQHVIKQAVAHQTPVVGYNQYFLDSGAALAFLIDYVQVGHQVAVQVENVLDGGECGGIRLPDYDIHVNDVIWQALQLDARRKRE